MEKLKSPAHAAELLTILDVLNANIERAGQLTDAATRVLVHDGPMQERLESFRLSVEIVRAGIVFTHAILEDGLRETLRANLRHNDDLELPDNMQFSGSTKNRISLGEMRSLYQGRNIDDIITISVDDFLDRMSFSSASDIVRQLESGGIRLPQRIRDAYLPSLEELCRRRHLVVHKADVVRLEDGKRQVTPVELSDFRRWQGMTLAFLLEVFRLGIPEEMAARLSGQIDAQIRRIWNSYELDGEPPTSGAGSDPA